MPTVRLILLIFLRENISLTQKVVKVPLIDSIYLNGLQVLELKFAKIDKREGPNKVRGVEKISKY